MERFIFDKEYWQDHLYYSQLYSQDLVCKRLNKIQEEIIQTRNFASAAFFAYEVNHNAYKMQTLIIESNNPQYIYFFARHVKNADIKALQKALINSTHPKRLHYLCQFARFISQANIKKIERVIVKSNNARYAHFFLKHIKGTQPDKFKKTIIDSGKPRYLYWLAKHLKTRREIALIERLIISAHSFTYVRLMAQYIPKADLNKLEQFVLDSGNVKQIKKFAKSVKLSKSRHLTILF